MIYALLDTCIYYRIITQGQPGCEMEVFGEFEQLVADKKIVALVPEVVLLELEKHRRTLPEQYSTHFGNLERFVNEAVSKKEVWNELGDVKDKLLKLLEKTREDKKTLIQKRFDQVDKWLQSADVRQIQFTNDIWIRAKRRLMCGKMPGAGGKSTRNQDQDASIVESALEVMTGEPGKLYLCSENVDDFGVQVEGKDCVLHPILQEDFPDAVLFLNLRSLLDVAKGEKPVSSPTPDEVKQAVAEDRQVDRSQGVYDAIQLLSEMRRIMRHLTGPLPLQPRQEAAERLRFAAIEFEYVLRARLLDMPEDSRSAVMRRLDEVVSIVEMVVTETLSLDRRSSGERDNYGRRMRRWYRDYMERHEEIEFILVESTWDE